jgi:hypothetical protein
MVDYQIRDVMNRKGHPLIEFQLRIQRIRSDATRLLVRFRNKSNVIANDYAIHIWLPIKVDGMHLHKEDSLLEDLDGNRFFRISMGNALRTPLFPNSEVILKYDLDVIPPYGTGRISPISGTAADCILCKVYADEMPYLERKISVAETLAGWI